MGNSFASGLIGNVVGGPTIALPDSSVPPFSNVYSLSFDGADDMMTIPEGTFDLGSGDWTFSLWFKAEALSGTSECFFAVEGDGRSPSALLALYAQTSRIAITDWHNDVIKYDAAVSDDTWYHLVARKKDGGGSGISLFLNGTEQATGIFPQTPDFGDDQTTTKVGTDQTETYPFNGLIDEFAFWSSALSDAEITNIYKGEESGGSGGTDGTPGDLDTFDPVGWWRMGDGGTWGGANWTIPDASDNDNPGTTDNMDEEDRVTDVP